jgi:ferric-dicitrate binding protein FerR (iron transport regulator)
MFKRLCLAAVVAFLLLGISPSIGQSQAAPRITVEWQSAPLSHVIDAFARFSGFTIVMAPDVDGQDVTAAFQNIDWQLALDAILEKQGLVARKDSSNAIHIEKRASVAAKITVEWQNASLSHVIENFARFSGRTIRLAPDVSEQDVTAAFRNVDWQLVLDAILEDKGLVARVDASGAIRVEKRAPAR